MKPSRAVVLALATWLAVVAAGSTAVWLVISRAGEDVGVATQRAVQAAPTQGTPTSGSGTAEGPTRSTPPSTAASGPAPSSPAPSSSAPASSAPATSPGDTDPSPGPTAQRRTWQGIGGYVTAQCRGGVIGLVAAQPDDGFSVTVGDRGPEVLEVHFEGHGGEDSRQSEVGARCTGGAPRFLARTEGEGGDD